MARSLVLIAALAGAALAADTTTVQIFALGDNRPIVGSVIHADATATTLSVNDRSNSAWGAIVTQGPSTCKWNVQVPAETGTGVISLGANCKLDPAKDEARCTVSTTSGSDSVIGQITTKYSESMRPVQITAGAEKLTAANTNDASVSASASATPAPTASGSTSGNTVSKTSAEASSSTGTNAAGPMVTQNAVWAGVAAVVGGALAL
ncbi:hypothetical protein EsDP_00000029 [Epichloe bromicola]|uniref:Uncharacterized protein n=1 Tax=Epichloe bromicola TaxID=79588 RepID=A0ABQ0CDP6_9HYPO